MITKSYAIIFLILTTLSLISNGQTLSEIPPKAIKFIHTKTLVKQAWDPFLSPNEEKIAFVKLDNLQKTDIEQINSQIWIMNSDGNEKQQLTFDEGFKHNPIFNSTGDLILFVQEPGDLFLMNHDGTNLRKLPLDVRCSGQTAWSPNGQLIAFDIAEPNRGIALYDFEKEQLIHIINLDEKSQRIRLINLTFSPDSRRLYYQLRETIYYLDITNNTINQIQKANQYSLSPNGKIIACLIRNPNKDFTILLIDTESFSTQELYKQTTSDMPFYRTLLWSPDSSKLIWGDLLFDIGEKTHTKLIYPRKSPRTDFRHKCAWFSQGKKIINEDALTSATIQPKEKLYRNRNISLYLVDWNSEFATKKRVISRIPEMITTLAKTLTPTNAEKLFEKTRPQAAPTRIVCTEIVNNIYDRMLPMAYNKYPKELEHVKTQTDRWNYEDPLVDGANWGFLRRLKSLHPLNGDFIKLEIGLNDNESNTLVRVDHICGYSVTIKEHQISTRTISGLEYLSQIQKVRYDFTIMGSDTLREDVTQLLLEELESFFALEFLFDANDIYGIGLNELLIAVQKENIKFTEEQIKKRYATAAQFTLPDNGWPQYKHDSSNSGFINESLNFPLELEWKKSFAGSYERISPIVDEKYVYVCLTRPENQYSVHVLDRKTGEIVGNIHTNEGVNTTPVVSKNHLFILWGERIVSAFEKETWKKIWTAYLPSRHEVATMTLSEGILICTNRFGYISAIDASDGKEIWKKKVSNVTGVPCIANGNVILADGNSLITLNLQTGKEKYNIKSEYGGFGYRSSISRYQNKLFAYSVHESRLYKSGYEGYFCAYNSKNGETLWEFPINQPYAMSSVTHPKVVFIQSDNLYALNIENGKELWRMHAGLLIVIGQYVLAMVDGNISAIDINTGEIVYKMERYDFEPVYAQPAYYDGFLYVLDSKANIYAFHHNP